MIYIFFLKEVFIDFTLPTYWVMHQSHSSKNGFVWVLSLQKTLCSRKCMALRTFWFRLLYVNLYVKRNEKCWHMKFKTRSLFNVYQPV